MRKLRLLHVAPAYAPAYCYGGPIYSVHGLCKALGALGHDVTVYTTDAGGEKRLDVPAGVPQIFDGVRVTYFPAPFLKKMFFSQALAAETAKSVRSFGLVHTHGLYAWPTREAARLARDNGVPYVISPRGMLVNSLIRKRSFLAKKLWIAAFERKNLERVAGVHATSLQERQNLIEFGIAADRITVVPNGADLPQTEGREGTVSESAVAAAAKGDYVLYVGRIDWMKGLERLVRAVSATREVRLLIAGSDYRGYRKHVETLVAVLGLADRVDFVGPVYGEDKSFLYRKAKLFALLSDHENFGNSVAEAMMHRCPVIVTPGVGAASYVKISGAGRVVSEDPTKIAVDIREMLSDAAAGKDAGEKGRTCALKELSWESVALKMTDLYEKVLTQRSA